MANNESLPSDLIEEYKVCQENAKHLSDNVWKSAVVFGVGSIAGIITLSQENGIQSDLKPLLVIAAGFFAIGVSFGWLKFVRRWLSIEQVMFRRMEHIERQSQFIRNTLYVRYFNNLKEEENEKRQGQETREEENEEGQRQEIEKRIQFETDYSKASLNKPFLDKVLLADLIKKPGLLDNYEYRGIQPMIKFIVWINVVVWAVFAILQVPTLFQ
jgi:hypothetical protein